MLVIKKHLIAATLPLFAVLLCFILQFIVGFDGLYGQDAYEYLRYANAIKKYLIQGIHPGDYFWPVWYPITGAFLSFIFQDMILSLQIVSSVSLAIVIIYSSKIIRLLMPEVNTIASNTYSILLIGISPVLFKHGFIIMSDMLTLAFITMSMYYLFSASISYKIKHIILGFLLASLAFMTRYAAIIIIAPICLYSGWIFIYKNKNWYFIIPAIIISTVPLIPHILIRNSQTVDFVQHNLLTSWNLANLFKSNFVTKDGTSSNSFPNILYSFLGLFHPRYSLFAFVLLFLGFRKIRWNSINVILSISIVSYLFFLSGIPFQNNRFLLLVQPLLMILLFPAALQFIHQRKQPFKIAIVTIILTTQIVLIPIGFRYVYNRNKFERNLYQYLVTINAPAIYTMDVDVALKGRGYPSPIYNIFTQTYPQPNKNAIIIYNENTFNSQWKGMNPYANWTYFNESFELKEIKHFSNGFGVYKFK